MARKTLNRKPLLSRLGEVLDRVILTLSPERGMKRMALRQFWDRRQSRLDRDDRGPRNSGGGFDGATSDRLYGHRWLTSRLSTDSRLELDHDDLRQRSREIYINDALGGAVDTRVNNVVGGGFRPQAKVKPLKGVLDEDQADAINAQLELLYDDVVRRISVDRRRSLWQLLRLADRHFDFDGEGLVVFSDVGDADQRIPLALEVVDPDRLQTPPEHDQDPLVRMGVERDASGKIVAYHIRRTHPDDTKEVDLKFERVPAERVCHVFEPWFAGQSRGLPLYTRALNDIRNAHDFEDATLIAAQVEAMHVGFVTSPHGASRAAIGAGNETTASGKTLQDLEPGTLRYLDPGESVEFGVPNRSGGAAGDFLAWIQRRISAAINFAYEFIAKDWRGVSFAGGRLVLTEVRLDCQARQRYLIELLLAPFWHRLVEEAVIVGAVEIDPRDFARYRRHFVRHAWIAPAFPYAINPKQEVEADIRAVEENHDSLANRLAGRGLDVLEILDAREWERAEERKRKIDPASRNALLNNTGDRDDSADDFVDDASEVAAD